MKNIIDKRFLLAAWTLFVFLLIAWPMPEGTETSSGNLDKVFHFFLFGIFAYLVAVNIKNKVSAVTDILTTFAISCLYAYLSEVVQLFVPGRDYSLSDFAAGVAGVCIFLAIFYVRNRK